MMITITTRNITTCLTVSPKFSNNRNTNKSNNHNNNDNNNDNNKNNNNNNNRNGIINIIAMIKIIVMNKITIILITMAITREANKKW